MDVGSRRDRRRERKGGGRSMKKKRPNLILVWEKGEDGRRTVDGINQWEG
jgi:hypothetical protein